MAETKFDALRYQAETTKHMGGSLDETTYEVYRDDGPFAHVATCYSEDAARLMVAAPDLYATCEVAHKLIESMSRQMLSNNSVTREFKEVESAMRAALNKAKGAA